MKTGEMLHTIIGVKAKDHSAIEVRWSSGERVSLDLSRIIKGPGFKSIRHAEEFRRVKVGEWGHSLTWPTGAELGADSLWLMTLTATGHDDARQFVEWRLRHGLSLSKAAEELGLSRRMVAYYSNAEKPVPRSILLACRGWEAEKAAA